MENSYADNTNVSLENIQIGSQLNITFTNPASASSPKATNAAAESSQLVKSVNSLNEFSIDMDTPGIKKIMNEIKAQRNQINKYLVEQQETQLEILANVKRILDILKNKKVSDYISYSLLNMESEGYIEEEEYLLTDSDNDEPSNVSLVDDEEEE